MPRFIVLYDACVLYPSQLRDVLMHLAGCELFQARWTERIHDEWTGNLKNNRPDLDVTKIDRTRAQMIKALPHAMITGYEGLEACLALPDQNDRHVLAAAIVGRVDVIVTENISDFPENQLKPYGIQAQAPDNFFLDQMSLDKDRVHEIVMNHWRSLKNPRFTLTEYLEMLGKQKLAGSAEALRAILRP